MEENASVLGATICLEGLDCVLESRCMRSSQQAVSACHSYIQVHLWLFLVLKGGPKNLP